MGVINLGTLNSKVINGPETFNTTFVGAAILIEQSVGVEFTGAAILIEQTITLQADFVGAAILIEQAVTADFSGAAILIEQVIRDSSVPSHLDRVGWDAIIKVGGARIPTSEIAGTLTITRTENNAALMDVEFIPPLGTQDPTIYQGKEVTVTLIEANTVTRLYTGTVNIPEYDYMTEYVKLRCSNKRAQLINSQFKTAKNNIGFYSTDIFSDPEDVNQEIFQRLETIPFALDFDAYNTSHLTAWEPKSTPHFVLGDADIFLETPQIPIIKYTQAGEVVNKINLAIEYRYPRNYHVQKTWEWESPIFDQPCFFLVDGYSRFAATTITSAAFGAGWVVRDGVDFDTNLYNGWYRCTLTTFPGAANSGAPIAFTHVNVDYATVPLTDVNGNVLVDPEGNTLTTVIRTGATDFTNVFADRAIWRATQRWAQTINEKYTVTVKAPQSIAQYGTIEKDESHGIESTFDSSGWEDYTAYEDLGLGNTYFIDRDTNEQDFRNAWITVINRAKTTILSTHRDNRCIFSRPIWGDIDLKHTVEVAATSLVSKGKVFKITHMLDFKHGDANTTIELSMTKSTGSTSATSITPPTRPTDNPDIDSSTVRLGNHFAEEPQEGWTGAIGNAYVDRNLTTYPVSFVVDTPAVQTELRETRELTGSESYNIEIPDNDNFMIYNGKT